MSHGCGLCGDDWESYTPPKPSLWKRIWTKVRTTFQGPVGCTGPMGMKGDKGDRGEPGYLQLSGFTDGHHELCLFGAAGQLIWKAQVSR